MKAKKWLIGCLALVLSGTLAVGCSHFVETEEEMITLKEEDGGSREGGTSAGKNEGKTSAGGSGVLGEIAEQVQAPDHYTADFSDGGVYVKVDAPVVIPKGEGFKTYRVKARPFEQEDYERVSHVLLKDAELWKRDVEAMASTNGMTLGEIEQRMEQLTEVMASAKALGPEAVKFQEAKFGRSFEELEKEIKTLDGMRGIASEEPVNVEVPALVTVDAGDAQEKSRQDGWLSANATVDGKDFWVSVDNVVREDWRWNTFQIIKQEEETGYFQNYYSFAGLTDAQKEGAAFSIEEIRAKAVEDAAAMGFTDFVPSGEEYYAIYGNEEEYDSIQDAVWKIGYGIHFTRSFDGIPVTYTFEAGTTLEEGWNVVWPYENLTLIYDEDGIANFVWGNPYEVEKVSDEYSFLLPFAEIQNIFEEMILKKYQDWIENIDDDIKIDLGINEVRLGYMRVREKETAKEATMIPVWDFLGEQKITYGGEESAYDEGSVFNSRITINALDGTIIDRTFGY